MIRGLVTVIIPCYNQARFLAEAIESVLGQSYSSREIIVVDDGSTDGSKQVASSYEGVKVISEQRRGLAGARNRGMEESRGEYIVFLDGDDRLVGGALEEGVRSLEAHPECAFVYGHYRTIAADGSHLSSIELSCFEKDHYLALLRRNFIGMHATVMYRRSAIESAGGFDTSLPACEDYDLYLRIARDHPVCCHEKVVAEYRQHESNMSGDAGLMLRTSLMALRSQWKYVKSERRLREAYRQGVAYWRSYYGSRLVRQMRAHAQARDRERLLQGILLLLRHDPRMLARFTINAAGQGARRAPKYLLNRLLRYRRSA